MTLPLPPPLPPRSTDPQTGRPLRDRRLLPNPCVRNLIAACCRALGAAPTAAPTAAPAAAPWKSDSDSSDSDSDSEAASPGGPVAPGAA
jgi:hypothetical protein